MILDDAKAIFIMVLLPLSGFGIGVVNTLQFCEQGSKKNNIVCIENEKCLEYIMKNKKFPNDTLIEYF